LKRSGAPTGTNDLHDVLNAEKINLWLPSDIPRERRAVVCKQGVDRLEQRFRLAQLTDFLGDMCKFMRFYAILRSQYKGEFAKKSSNITRARDELTKYKNIFLGFARRYRESRSALLSLDPEGDWTKRFQELRSDQLKGPYIWDDQSDLEATRLERHRELGGGHYTPPWFWTLNLGPDGRHTEPIDQIRVQWAKLMAHAERWDEELIKVPEEMRCTLAAFETEAKEWMARVDMRTDPQRPWLKDSLNAYAHRQAALRYARRDQFAREWLPLLRAAKAGGDWTTQYDSIVPSSASAGTKRRVGLTTTSGGTTTDAPTTCACAPPGAAITISAATTTTCACTTRVTPSISELRAPQDPYELDFMLASSAPGNDSEPGGEEDSASDAEESDGASVNLDDGGDSDIDTEAEGDLDGVDAVYISAV
jgi:hypothetical protein